MPNTEENTEEIICLSTDLLVIKAGDSKITKTSQIKAQPERPAVEYREAITASQEITITVKDEAIADATIDRLLRAGYSTQKIGRCVASPPTEDEDNGGRDEGALGSDTCGEATDSGETVGGDEQGDDQSSSPRTLRVSLEPGKENLATFREAFKLAKHKDHGNKVAIAAEKTAKQATKDQAAQERERTKKLKAEEKRAAQEKKDVASLDAIKNKERDRVLKEKIAENTRLEVRIKQDEATLKAIKGLIKKRGYTTPESDEEIEQRAAAITADKETLSMNKRAIKKEEDSRKVEAPKVEEPQVEEGITREKITEAGLDPDADYLGLEEGDFIHDESPKDIEDDLEGFGPTDGDFLAGM